MPALRIFDPYAFLADEDRTAPPAKPAGAVAHENKTLAALATLAGGQPQTLALRIFDPYDFLGEEGGTAIPATPIEADRA